MTENNSQIRSHRNLIAWQKAMDLVVTVYSVGKTFPKEELFALTNQMRRAAASVPANIAEGQGRRSKGEFRQFLGNARGSLLELDTHMDLAFRLGYLNAEQYDGVQNQLQEVGRIINGLLRSLADNT
ncbi:MAG TPA: four helix bundle protein [Pyrinomonadaceae bacterium]|nr:four helix bundle protein [Pyrinomonadaceae bacterium]